MNLSFLSNILIASVLFYSCASGEHSRSTKHSSTSIVYGTGGTWWPDIYGDTWDPSMLGDFYTHKIIQDFSYAGYHSGERKLPQVAGPIYDVTKPPFNADSTGVLDATYSIQSAIDRASESGLLAGRALSRVSNWE